MKKFILPLAVFAAFVFIMAGSAEWTEYKTVDGVKFSEKSVEQTIDKTNETHSWIVFQIENTNDYDIKVTWKQDIWYNGVCRTCDQPEPSGYMFEKVLKAGESISGDPSDESNMLKIYSHIVSPARPGKLTKYEFKNITVEKQ